MKNYKSSILILTLIILLFTPINVTAHPGRLDFNGGHYNRDTGEYHYHDGSHSSSDSSSNYITDDYDEYDYDYTTKEYVNTYSPETTTRIYSYDNDKTNTEKKENDTMYKGLIIFIIVIALAILLLLAYVYSQLKNKLSDIDSKVKNISEKNLEIIDIINTIKQNDIEFNNGYKLGSNSAAEELTPRLIEKAYQMGVRDAEKINEQHKEIRKMFSQGIKVNIDVPNPKETYNYVKKDDTIKTDPFVSIGPSLEELLRVPIGIKIDKNLKIVDTKYPEDKYGRYTVYKTKTGDKIHLKKGCCNAYLPYLSFKGNDYHYYNRCNKCFPNSKVHLLTIPEWYSDFRTYKRKNNIDISSYEQDFL